MFPKPVCFFMCDDIVSFYALKNKLCTCAERDALLLTLKLPDERTAYYHTQVYIYQISTASTKANQAALLR